MGRPGSDLLPFAGLFFAGDRRLLLRASGFELDGAQRGHIHKVLGAGVASSGLWQRVCHDLAGREYLVSVLTEISSVSVRLTSPH